MGNPFGRSVILPLTNQSGASVAAGDVVYLDTAHDDSFTTGTTGAYTGGIGIAQQAIGAGSTGLVLVQGYASLVNVNASVTRGNYGKTYTVAKQATDAGSSRVAGAFCQFLKGGTTPDAMVWQPDLGSGGGSSVTVSNGIPSADVSVPNTGTWTDLCSISLAAGTYLAWGQAVYNWSAQASVGFRIYDGTNVLGAIEVNTVGTPYNTANVMSQGSFVLGSTTTVKLQSAALVSGTVKKIQGDFATGVSASTYLVAAKIA